MDDTKALQLYPHQQEVDTLAHRIRDLLPGADTFNDEVLVAFAQISLAHGLDPWIGEIWIIPTKRGPRIRAGIEGHRKAAHRQSPYQIRQRPMTGEERDQHQLRDDQIGAITEIYRADSVIHDQVYRPTLGYGIYSKGERIPHTKTGMWLAFKRSEQDALRKAFDLPFVSEERNGTGPPLPAQAMIANGDQPAPRLEAAGSAQAAAADLYGDWDGEVFAAGEDHPPTEEHEQEQEEIIDTTATEITDEPPLDKWGSFTSPQAAITWATRQGAFDHIDHARNAYNKLRTNAHPKNAQQMAQLWLADVTYRREEAAAEA